MANPQLNLIGAGKLGRALTRLWHDKGLITVGSVMARSDESATQARDFIGAGQPCTADFSGLLPDADLWLLATPDDRLSTTVEYLASLDRDWRDRVVFHCSGACASSILAPLAAAGAQIASSHPIHSFADPETSQATFSGTFCLLEGEPAAVSRLAELFTAIGARTAISPDCDKALYHAATAMASNLLVALLCDAERMLSTATGLPVEQARQLLAPLSRQTLDNWDRLGPHQALTGPLARGDIATVARHLKAVRHTPWAETYTTLSKTVANIVTDAPSPPSGLEQIQELLDDRT